MLRHDSGGVAEWLAGSTAACMHHVVPSHTFHTWTDSDVSSHGCPSTSAPDAPGPSVGAVVPENSEIIAAHAAFMSPAAAPPVSEDPGRMTEACDNSCSLYVSPTTISISKKYMLI